MGKWLTCLPRLMLAQLRTLRSTTERTCHRGLAKFPSPRWESFRCACPDSRLHNCERFGQLQGVSASETLQSSPCPDGRLTFCSLFAGRWCLCRGCHSDHLIVHHQWELSSQCARSSSKVPNAPMGCLAFVSSFVISHPYFPPRGPMSMSL
jgi:hypothetical protein